MTDDQTARFALPMLQPGQAQKELYHNEALALLDIVVQASVVAMGQNSPPPSPALGACWVVGAAPTGGWAGEAHRLAGWTGGGWRFVAPVDGMTVWSVADALEAQFIAGSWVVGQTRSARLLIAGTPVVGPQRAAIAPPIGGTTVDSEARAALSAILSALAGHGLIAS